MSKSLFLKRVVAFTIAILFVFNPFSRNNNASAEDEYSAMSGAHATENERIFEVLNNISESYTCTADPWRILDLIAYLGRAEAKANLSVYLGGVDEMLASPAPSLYSLGTAGLVLSALGYDISAYPAGESSINLINLIEESAEFYTIDGVINLYSASNALYALNSADYEIAENIDGIVEDIALAQYPDGGWGFDGVNGDVDTTAMCVAALAPYRDDSDISAVLQRALDFLSAAQCDSGGYSSFGTENCNTSAMVVIALVALGVDPESDTRYKKGENTIIDALMSYCTEGSNGFGYSDNKYNSYATEQAYRALISYVRFIENGKPENGFSPYSFGGYTGVAQDASEYDTNLTSLAVTDCDLIPIFDSALTNYELNTDKSSIDIILTKQSEEAQVTINQKTDSNVPLLYGDNTVKVEVRSKNAEGIKEYTISAFRTGGDNGGGGVSEKTINVSIIGVNESTILPRTSVKYKAGDTPLSVLKRVAAEHEIEVASSGSGSSAYVTGIDGLYELDRGAGSGWMYSINGTFHQTSAAVLKLKAGDELKWVYTTELGDDVGGGVSYTKKEAEESEKSEVESYSATEITELIEKITNTIPLKPETSNWGMFAHARLSSKLSYELVDLLKTKLGEYSGGFRKITDAAGLILSTAAAGFDVCDIEGENLVEKLLNSDRMLIQGLNGPIFSLIAIDSVNNTVKDTVWSRESLLATILDAQNADGGFSLTESEDSNIDITAMAVYALSGHKGNLKVERAIESAVKFISEEQLDSGGFMLYNQENCESAAQVIIALTALGIDPIKDERFIKDDISLIDVLLRYRLADGGFAHIPGETANDMATEQALLALMAYSNYLEGAGGVYALKAPNVPIFSDAMEISSWAFEAVMEAAEAKLMVGSGGFFKPGDSITRAELAQLLTRLFELDKDMDVNAKFTDVAIGAWYEDAINAVSQAGLMFGTSDSQFNPNSLLTREELAVVIYRALKLPSGEVSAFSDTNDISVWARDAVGAVASAGIIMGSGGAFHPQDDVTRETAATVFMRIKAQI